MHAYGNGMGMGGWIVMIVSMVAFWTVVVLLVVALIRHLSRTPHPLDSSHAQEPGRLSEPSTQSAERILAERFARGDVDEDEYHRRQRTLWETKG